MLLVAGMKAIKHVSLCCNRHPSNEFSYGNTSVTVKMMTQNGSFLSGKLTQELGYVSNWLPTCKKGDLKLLALSFVI